MSYSSKVQAFPFVVSKRQIIRTLAPVASLFSLKLTFRDLLGVVFSGLRGQPPIPLRIQPVYFPGWYIDAEMQGSVWLKHQGKESQRSATVNMARSYLPGFPFEPICRLSLAGPKIEKVRSLPFSNGMATVDGEEVACMPYTISPASPLNLTKTLPESKCSLDDMCFDPASIQPNFVAAYPVLFPLYIVQYELSEVLASMLEPGATLQIVVEAHVRNGRISVYPALPPDLPPIVDFLGHEVTHLRDIAPRTFASCDYDPSTTLSSSYDNSFPTFQMKVSQWLNGLIRHSGSAQQLSMASDIPWDEDSAEGKKFWDQNWIRRWDLDDVKANRAFLLDPRPDRQKPEWWTGWTSQETS